MKKIYLLLLLVIASNVYCQIVEKHELLWEISGNGLSDKSYLFGTAHDFSSLFLERVPNFYKVFNSVKEIVFELSPAEYTETKIIELAKKYPPTRYLPDSIDYKDILDEYNLHLLDSILLTHLEIKSSQTRLKPSLLYDRIRKQRNAKENIYNAIDSIKETRDSFSDDNMFKYMTRLYEGKKMALDMYLMKETQIKGIKATGLDSLEYQIRLKFRPNISLEQEAKSMMCKLLNSGAYQEALSGVIYSYFEQDLNKLLNFYTQHTQLSGFESYADNPLNELKIRNTKWIPAIKKIIQNNSAMIIVGVGHLIGKYGLINLLREEGYIVTPISK